MTDADNVQEAQKFEQSDIEELTKDYGRYLQVDASKERQSFYDSIDEMLTKLDEFGGLVDGIRSDTTMCLNKNIPEIQAKAEAIREIFTKVDQLEEFVKIVRLDVNKMEGHVTRAENEMGSLSGIKKKFSNLFGSKKPLQSRESRPPFTPPDIFVTEEYLHPSQPVQQVDSARTTTSATQQMVPPTTGQPGEQSTETAGTRNIEKSEETDTSLAQSESGSGDTDNTKNEANT